MAPDTATGQPTGPGRWGMIMPAAARSEWRGHWPIVFGAAAGYALAAVINYIGGVLIQPLEQAFGWSRAEISSGQFIVSITAVLLGPLIGIAVDRHGPRRIALIGVTALCVSIGTLSTATGNIAWWWMLWGFVGISALFAKVVVWTSGVASFFSVGRGLAFATLMCGGSFTATVTPLMTAHLIDSLGWRTALVATGGVWFLVTFPIVFFCFSSARDRARIESVSAEVATPVLPGFAPREGLGSSQFLRIGAGGLAFAIGVTPFSGLAVPLLSSFGHERMAAAAIAGLLGISALLGRLTTGFLLDRLVPKYVTAATVLLPALAGIVVLAFGHGTPGAAAAVILAGFAFGAEIDAIAFLAARYFGMRSFGLLFSIILGLTTFGNGFGPFLFNLVYDRTGSYQPAAFASVGLCLFSALMFASLGRPPDFAAPSQNASASLDNYTT